MQANDLVLTAERATCRLASRVVPRSDWPVFADGWARLAMRARPSRTERGLSTLSRYFPQKIPGRESKVSLLRRSRAAQIEEGLLYAQLARDERFRPPLSVEGHERVREALRRGEGVILWTVTSAFTPLLVRMAGHDLGWPMHHLSWWRHGGTGTRYGDRVLSSPRKRVEERYARLLTISESGPAGAVLEVGRVLKGGGVVQVQGVDRSVTRKTLPLFDGHMTLADGAPRVALMLDAALFGVAATRAKAGAPFRLRFVPIETADLSEAVEAFRRLVEQTYAESPDLWPIHRRQFREAHHRDR